MNSALKAYIRQIQHDTGPGVKFEQITHYPAAPYHAECKDAVRRAAQALDYSHRESVSGVGHVTAGTTVLLRAMLKKAGLLAQ
nr:hypothetical protein [uncultured Enterobacter sp.]